MSASTVESAMARLTTSMIPMITGKSRDSVDW